MARILICGCGYVGTSAALQLIESGHEVFGLRRDPSGLPASIRPIAADLAASGADDPFVEALPRGVDFLIYSVAPGGRTEAAYRRAYVDGPRRVLAALARRDSNLTRAVLVSSTAVYGQAHGEAVDERSPCSPSSRTARIVREGERRWLQQPAPTCALRLGGIYGPGRERLIRQVRAGSVALPREPSAFTNRIHRDDAAGIAAHLLGPRATAEVYNGVDTEPARMGTVLSWLAERLDVRLASDQDPGAAPAGSRDRARGMNKRVCSARVQRSGYRFRYPTFREGYAALLRS